MRHPAWTVLLFVVGFAPAAAPQADDPIRVAETDWPWWRGPRGDGTAHVNQKPPLTWSATENVVWKTEVPGRGHGSPTVFGDHVYLAACDETTASQSVLCFDRATGRRLWET